MYLEVARDLTDWFNDPTNGVVAKLAGVPRDGSDPLPVVGTIADQTRNNLVAQKKLPSIPGISVLVVQIPMLDGEIQTVTGDGVADVLVRVGRSDVDTMNAVRDTSYILRALIRSWRAYNLVSPSRQRNGIQIYSCEKLAIAPDWTPIDDGIMTGAANAHMQFRDIAPFG